MKFDVDAHAETLATKAVKGYREAIYCNGKYFGETFESSDLVCDGYPSEEIFEAVHAAACDLVDDWGGPWCTEETYAAFTGGDEDERDATSVGVGGDGSVS